MRDRGCGSPPARLRHPGGCAPGPQPDARGGTRPGAELPLRGEGIAGGRFPGRAGGELHARPNSSFCPVYHPGKALVEGQPQELSFKLFSIPIFFFPSLQVFHVVRKIKNKTTQMRNNPKKALSPSSASAEPGAGRAAAEGGLAAGGAPRSPPKPGCPPGARCWGCCVKGAGTGPCRGTELHGCHPWDRGAQGSQEPVRRLPGLPILFPAAFWKPQTTREGTGGGEEQGSSCLGGLTLR